MPDKTKKYPTCPECGSGGFVIEGLVGYRQAYDASLDHYDNGEIDWNRLYPQKAQCRSCEYDATDLFREYDHLPFFVSVPLPE